MGNAMTNYLFLSYAHADKAICQVAAKFLNQTGFYVWYDKGIKVGEDWQAVLNERIRSSSGVVVLLTPRSAESPDCRIEWQYADDAGVKIYPVMIEKCVPPYPINQYHWLGPSAESVLYRMDHPAVLASPVVEVSKQLGQHHPAFCLDLLEYNNMKMSYYNNINYLEVKYSGVKGFVKGVIKAGEKRSVEESTAWFLKKMREHEQKINRAFVEEEVFLFNKDDRWG